MLLGLRLSGAAAVALIGQLALRRGAAAFTSIFAGLVVISVITEAGALLTGGVHGPCFNGFLVLLAGVTILIPMRQRQALQAQCAALAGLVLVGDRARARRRREVERGALGGALFRLSLPPGEAPVAVWPRPPGAPDLIA